MSKYTKPVLNVGDVIYGTDPTSGVEKTRSIVTEVEPPKDGSGFWYTLLAKEEGIEDYLNDVDLGF